MSTLSEKMQFVTAVNYALVTNLDRIKKGRNVAWVTEEYGNWHSSYTRAKRWAKNGVLDRVFAVLQEKDVINIQVNDVSLDSTAVKVHPDGTGRKKTVNNLSVSRELDGQSIYIWLQPTL